MILSECHESPAGSDGYVLLLLLSLLACFLTDELLQAIKSLAMYKLTVAAPGS